MTSWVWMQGVDVAVADPIDPVTPEDDRPSVKALIQEHREKLDKIKAVIKDDPLYDARKHDDLWILRFWLSHKKSQKAIDAAKHTLQFRAEHKLDEVDIRAVEPHHVKDGLVYEYWSKRFGGNSLLFTIPDSKRGVICFIKLANSIVGASSNISKEAWDYAFIYSSEWSHQWLDYVTRTTGRLTKSIRFIDMTGMSISHISRADMKRDGEIMGKMEDCYPQLLETINICNAFKLIHAIWEIGRPLMPSRVVDKIDIINPIANEKERNRLRKHISIENLPEAFGGKNTVPPQDWIARTQSPVVKVKTDEADEYMA